VPRALPMAIGAPLLGELEIAGPYMLRKRPVSDVLTGEQCDSSGGERRRE